MKHYIEQLPNYLDGPNIQAHSRIIDNGNREVNELLGILSLWNDFTRPILIERIQTSQNNLTIKVHIQTRQAIQQITITGDYTYSQQYNEKDLIQEQTITFNKTQTPNQIHNPDITVTVETYDEITYKKSYPENDNKMNNTYDHDEFLDRIGNLIGINRRIYTSYPYVEGVKADPSYFGKQVTGGVVEVCTEDDFYYSQRIQYFLNNFNTVPLPVLLLRVMYGYTEVTELNVDTINEESGVWEYIKDNEVFIEEVNKAGTYIFLVNKNNPVNIGGLVGEDKLLFVEKYIPMTRLAYIFSQLVTSVGLDGFVWPRGFTHEFGAVLSDQYNKPVPERSFKWSVDDLSPSTSTVSDEQGHTDAVFDGMNVGLGYHTVTVTHLSGGGYESSTDTRQYKSYIDVMSQEEEITGEETNGLFSLLPWRYASNYSYWLRCSGVLYNFVFELPVDGVMTRYKLSELLEGEHTILLDPSGNSVFVDGVQKETIPLLDGDKGFVFQEETVQVYPLTTNEDTLQVTTWITDYHKYNQENITGDEFTLRYHLYKTQSTNTYPVEVVCDGHTWKQDIQEYTNTGLNIVELKFINYQCHVYINDVDTGYVLDYEHYTVTREGQSTALPLTTTGTDGVYNHNPILTGATESYTIPITNLPRIPETRPALDTTLTLQIPQEYYNKTVLDLIPYNDTETRGIPIKYTLKDTNNQPLTTPLTVLLNKMGEQEEITLPITDGATDTYTIPINQYGQLDITAQYTGGWKRNPATNTTNIPVQANPSQLTIETTNTHDNTREFYISPSVKVQANIHLEAKPINTYIQDHPLRPIQDTIEVKFDGTTYRVPTDSMGNATLQLPMPQPTSGGGGFYPLEVRYHGNSIYQETEHPGRGVRVEGYNGLSMEILSPHYTMTSDEQLTFGPKGQTYNPPILELPPDVPYTLKVRLNGHYGEPLPNQKIYYTSDIYAYTDEQGIATLTLPGSSTEATKTIFPMFYHLRYNYRFIYRPTLRGASEITITKVAGTTLEPLAQFTQYTVQLSLKDKITGETFTGNLIVTKPDGTTTNITARNGEATFTFRTSHIYKDQNNNLTLKVNYNGQTYSSGEVVHHPTEATATWTLTKDTPVTLKATAKINNGARVNASIVQSDMPCSIKLQTDDSRVNPSQDVSHGLLVYGTPLQNNKDNKQKINSDTVFYIPGHSIPAQTEYSNYIYESFVAELEPDTLLSLDPLTVQWRVNFPVTNPTTTTSLHPTSVAINKIKYTDFQYSVTYQDPDTLQPLVGKKVTITQWRQDKQYTTDNTGTVTIVPDTSQIKPSIPITASLELPWDGNKLYQNTTTDTLTVTSSEAIKTGLSMSITTTTIDSTDLATTDIPVSLQLQSDEPDFKTQIPITGQPVEILLIDKGQTTILQTLTTDGNGTVQTNIQIPQTSSTNVTIQARYNGQTDTYTTATSTTHTLEITGQLSDPYNDTDFLNLANWGTYPSASSSTAQSGTPTPATTGDLTINTTTHLITPTSGNKKYHIYNKSLKDFLDYYNNEFHIIAKKSGGDGRYWIGFLNTTTSKKLGFMEKGPVDEAKNIKITSKYTMYNKYCEITFKRTDNQLTMYWYGNSDSNPTPEYASYTFDLTDKNLEEYYFYFRDSHTGQLTVTNDSSYIEHPSRPS